MRRLRSGAANLGATGVCGDEIPGYFAPVPFQWANGPEHQPDATNVKNLILRGSQSPGFDGALTEAACRSLA